MAFKSAAENLFEDDQQLWPSNLLLLQHYLEIK
jgi:hypothetical protein